MKKFTELDTKSKQDNSRKLASINSKISRYTNKTPVLTSTAINKLSGTLLYFKCENFQKTGSFKIRGAINAVLALSRGELKRGVVTHSSGNFAQALAYAAKCNTLKKRCGHWIRSKNNLFGK